MLALNSQMEYYLYGKPTDMRKGFDGLSGIVTNQLGENPMNGKVYIFMNRRADRMKLLVWEQNGFTLYYKRLEKGRFEVPVKRDSEEGLSISWETLMLLISGIRLDKIVRKKRYNPWLNTS